MYPRVVQFLVERGLAPKEFDEPTPTVETAAKAVGCSPAEIAKTLLVEIGGVPLAVLTCGDTRLRSSLAKQASGLSGKLTFLQGDQVTDLTGFPPGGVCPFLLPERVPLFLDLSLQRFSTVYPAAGSRSSAVAVPVDRLEELTGGRWAELCLGSGEGA